MVGGWGAPIKFWARATNSPSTSRSSFLKASTVYATATSTKGGRLSTKGLGDISWSATYVPTSSPSLSSSSDSSSFSSSFRSSSRPVAMAKLTVADTIAVDGAHLSKGPSFLSTDQPPNAWDKSPQRLAASRLNSWRRLLQRGQRNKKWSTVSKPRLHLHWSESTAWIFARYEFNLHIPVRNWQRICEYFFERPL